MTIAIDFNGLEVAIIDNDPGQLPGLINLLGKLHCDVVWTARDHEEAIEKSNITIPKIIFSDLELVNGSRSREQGWNLIKELRARQARPCIIIYSGTPVEDEIVLEAIHIGCSYVIKEDLWGVDQEIIAAGLLAAYSGSVFLSKEVASSIEGIISRVQVSNVLTSGQLRVLALIAQGFSNQAISQQLNIAETTVKTHVSHIFTTLKVRNRNQAGLWYQENYGV